jgi:pyruvate formate lyase activating enzyme
MQGLIFSIKRYSVHDGPGIRVTVFLKGCPLRCKWCHNPEGISPLRQKIVTCHRIGDKEFYRDEQAGRYCSVEEISAILERERVFINKSKGGVTFSGGEPLLQPEFLLEVLKASGEMGYHTAVDTSGYSAYENYRLIIPYTDLFLFDLKHLDESAHIEGTGTSNIMILENYRRLLSEAKEVALRIPVIPGFNDDPDHIGRLIKFIISTRTGSLGRISLLPFHKTGSSKYRRLELPCRMDGIEPPSEKRMKDLKEQFLTTGLRVKIGG